MIRTNVVRATFTNAVRNTDPVAYTHAVNPENWTVTHTLGKFSPPVMRCVAVDGDPKSVDLWLMCPLIELDQYDVVAAANVRDA